jgi:hypothetical protein
MSIKRGRLYGVPTKRNRSAEPASPVKPPRPAEIPALERDLATVMRRYDARAQALEQATAERDRVIRDAHAGGVTPSRIAEITSLTPQRVAQIRHGTRGHGSSS